MIERETVEWAARRGGGRGRVG
ncbi:hypothetical protein TIFTF001_029951, partial [Ficus carica]